MSLLVVLALLFALAAAACLAGGVAALRRRRAGTAVAGGSAGLLFLAVGLLLATISVSIQGYRAFTREEVAAVVETRPTGEHAFRATLHLPDSTRRSYALRGDQLYVDAHILKWKPVANLLGLHTAYELERVGGRYASVEDERSLPRTVHGLAEEKPVDMFDLRRRFALLSPLVDAEYGSATFIGVDVPARIEIRVSTTGLLAREVEREAGREP